MKSKNILFTLCIIALSSFCFLSKINAQSDNNAQDLSKRKTVAIFARNGSNDKSLNEQTQNFALDLSSTLSNFGFSVIDPNMVIEKTNEYLNSANNLPEENAKQIKLLVQNGSLNPNLFDEASLSQIAKFIGADYIIVANLSSFDKETRIFQSYNISTTNTTYFLYSNYNVYDANGANSLAGGSILSSKNIRQTSDLKILPSNILNTLLQDTSLQIANSIIIQNVKNQFSNPNKDSNLVDITIICKVEDMSIPAFKLEDGKYVLTNLSIAANIQYVNVDIDGVSYPANAPINLSKGIHTLKINQKDIMPIAKNIFVNGKNQTLFYSLQLTDNARARWKENFEFIEQIKQKAMRGDNERILTQAQAEKIMGIAKMYEQSGYKVDTDTLPNVYKTQSTFSQ